MTISNILCETYSASFAQVLELSHMINLQIYVKYVIIGKYTACIYYINYIELRTDTRLIFA